MSSPENLLNRIEILRKQMTEVALNKGFTDLESIAISQELDRLLNVFENTKENSKAEDME